MYPATGLSIWNPQVKQIDTMGGLDPCSYKFGRLDQPDWIFCIVSNQRSRILSWIPVTMHSPMGMLKLETIAPKFWNYLKLMVDFANTDPRIWGSLILRHPHLIFLECSHWVLWIMGWQGFRRNSWGTSPRICRNYNRSMLGCPAST